MGDDIRYLKDIGCDTRERDNTVAERRAAMKHLKRGARNPAELEEWRQMLGIEAGWL